LTEIISQVNLYVLAFAISLPSLLVCFFFIPLFSGTQVPRTLRAGIAVGVIVPVAIALSQDSAIGNFGAPDVMGLIFKELSIGLILGVLFATPFWVMQSMGALIDNQRGALSAGYNNPASGPDASMLGDLMNKVLVIIFIDFGMFVQAVQGVYTSYSMWSPLVWIPFTESSNFFILIENFNEMAIKYILYSGPIVLVLLLIEASFAIMGAYSPQLQVYFMAMPAKSLAALLVLYIYLNFIGRITEYEMEYFRGVMYMFEEIFKR
jgi:type III secretion protein T